MKKIEVDTIITLCEIIDEYGEFSKELESLIESKRNKDLIYKVYNVMKGNFTIGKLKYKKFVNKYQNVIEIMKKNKSLSNMTIVRYNPDGKPNKDSTEDYFYEYILKNIDSIDTIKQVALKLKSLGFYQITFDETLKFEEYEYEYDKEYGSKFDFLENMEVLPAYSTNPIKYKTNSSCYAIQFYITGCMDNQNIHSKQIKLNSLVFDPNRLPDEFTKKTTLEQITNQFEKRKKEYEEIEKLVDMSVAVHNLMNQYAKTKAAIEKMNNVENKEQLNQILHNILSNIQELKKLENEIIDSSEQVPDEVIRKEKSLYLDNDKINFSEFYVL